MSKSTSLGHSTTLNLVFLFCLAGSILFAVTGQIKAHNHLCSTAVSLPAATHPVPVSAG